MRRLPLVLIALYLIAVVFAGTAPPTDAATPSGQPAGALAQEAEPGDADGDGIEDADDKCPMQPGSEQANGCPDADSDGVTDSADSCPTQSGAPTDGCPAWRVYMNGYLQERAAIYASCIGRGCKIAGDATLKLTAASKRKLKLSSTTIGTFPFEHPCGAGVVCAQQHLSSKLRKRAKAYADVHNNPVYLAATLTVKMTSPRKETLSKSVKLGPESNGGRFTICSTGYPPGAQCR